MSHPLGGFLGVTYALYCIVLTYLLTSNSIVHLVCAEKPSCSADRTVVQVGDDIHLSCRMAFAGAGRPNMAWFVGDEQLPSYDASLVGQARIKTTIPVTTHDDRRPFGCVATLSNLQQVCNVTVEVQRKSPSHHRPLKVWINQKTSMYF